YFLTGEKFNAETARSIGLIQHVVPNEAARDALIDAKTGKIMSAAPEGIAATKALILAVSGRPVESMSETTAMASVASPASAEAKAGIRDFISRRTQRLAR